jgi:hypothetical protein
MEMRNARVFCAAVMTGVSAAGAIWLFTYQESSVFRFIDPTGSAVHPARFDRVQPWWSVLAAVALLSLGAAMSLLMLPERPRVLMSLAHLISSERTSVENRPRHVRHLRG